LLLFQFHKKATTQDEFVLFEILFDQIAQNQSSFLLLLLFVKLIFVQIAAKCT